MTAAPPARSQVSVGVLAVLFIVAGAPHFLYPETYLRVMPPQVPFPIAANYLSGAAEIAGGIGVLVPRLRRAAGWGLIALLVAVFPANVHMALHSIPGVNLPGWLLWARLPLQVPLIWWVWAVCLKRQGRR